MMAIELPEQEKLTELELPDMLDISLSSIRSWLGEFFEPNEFVGVRGEGTACLVANYIRDKYNVDAVHVNGVTALVGDDQLMLPKEISHLVSRFDNSGQGRTSCRASTALNLVKRLEEQYITESIKEKELVGV